MAIRWSDWASLGTPSDAEIGQPFVQRNQDGRLEVFAAGSSGIFNIWQVAPNAGWHEGWHNKERPPNSRIAAHVVGRNAGGRLEIFAVADDGSMWHRWQVRPSAEWGDWRSLGKPDNDKSLTGQLAIARNQDGRQEIFAVAVDGRMATIWQKDPNGDWSNWGTVGQPPAKIRFGDRITVENNEDGRQELFAMGGDDALWHTWQVAPNVGWSGWVSLGKPSDMFDGSEPAKDRKLFNPVVKRNADGHLEVFAPGNGAFCNRWQENWRDGPDRVVWRHQGWNQKPKPRPDVGINWLDAALNFQNRLEVIGFGDDGALWHAWQIDQAPFWSNWASLGSPPPSIHTSEQLAVGTNQDGRLEVFVSGEDRAVWHIWQTR